MRRTRCLPELSGKALYSEKLAWIHVWTTFVAGMIVFGIWLVQGSTGRRVAGRCFRRGYDTLTRVSLPFVFLLAAAQGLFFWNVLQTLRGKGGVATFDERGIPKPGERSTKDWSVPAAEGALVLVFLFLAFAFAAGGYLVGREHGEGRRRGHHDRRRARAAGRRSPAMPEAGANVFASAGCGGCHTLAAAGSTGNVGPVARRREAVGPPSSSARVTNGKGAMPPFGDQLEPAADRGRRRLRRTAVDEVGKGKAAGEPAVPTATGAVSDELDRRRRRAPADE